MMPSTNLCPCGSQKTYGNCCQPAHQGQAVSTPEALMRSRYSAFVLGLGDYLLASWHPSTRPPVMDPGDSPQWVSLQVVSSSAQGAEGKVHFRAIYSLGNGFGYLEETSDFIREEGRWYYLSGDPREGKLDPGRNDPCPCGSGRKYKACGLAKKCAKISSL